ncbi:glutathione S-transferase, amine-terminal domain protein (macronuclear) [Tetrahymena thermophila SB210]|uniref:glutathione transferase n=1 Tax=Tetrahymena thermophila (strain SB210) TaxID=312017 RepID=I7LVV2_TETTS|nr:glutathione S-transferase, amine-terminal domain protein [Tetrahymena thermophila SB210]EAR99881.1 glutathione S-transferase, amine-terminal domain protein [Tetrahymena thermophila SB210]|eukprot:XP_001020126.1 glutathione S-transferase, amine-terminal domain protein [Tetrahymena thermophila SB210]
MITLGYWNVRGLGQSIRFLLAYLGVEYNSKVYSTAEEWFGKDKNNLGLEFPNIPYIIDGEFKLTESSAIPIYLLRKYKRADLLGFSNDGSYSEREVRVAQLIGVIKDIYKETIPVCFSPDFDKIKDQAFAKGEVLLKKLVSFLGDKEFLLSTLTYADFLLYEVLCYYKYIYPQAITPTLTAYMNRFENLPGIKQYIANPSINLKAFLPTFKSTWSGPQ